ncbi:hypothetical protein JW935_01550 [candidate division KSB1 bacterium]|nr:hypothetical protein [candidate division KSB1 bacterium]
MGIIDLAVFSVYFTSVLGIGVYFYLKNKSKEDYYVGSRKISPAHIGMSIVATDVGGGFSVGLGGLGFVMGLSASWLLFSGLLGAWLAAVLIVPKLKKLDMQKGLYTFSFMVAGLFVPTIAAYFLPKANAVAAKLAMFTGGGFTLAAILFKFKLPIGLDASVFGIGISFIIFYSVSKIYKKEVVFRAGQD